MSWYALYVETGREEQVKRYINNTIDLSSNVLPYELLIVKKEVFEKKKGVMKSVTKKVFPGYILLETENILDFYLNLKFRQNSHFFGILRQGNYFQEICLEEISNIIYMINEKGMIGCSDIFVENDRIIVTEGPLKHYDGYIKKIDRRKQRVLAVFMFRGARHDISLSVNFIKKYDDSISGKEISFYANYCG